jgi:uncharacterized protein
MHEFVFVIKASKFCNLRCAYCYEHRELHVRDQMDAETLGRLFASIDAFGNHLVAQGVSPRFSFVWHGGEPLLLPPAYYSAMATLQRENIRSFAYRNSVQTNLFGNVHAALAAVMDLEWEVGVSIDFAGDIRANAAGRDSNDSVIAAAEALHRSGSGFGVISVLGKHNCRSLPQVYDWVSEFATGWRILPMFGGGPEDSIARLRLPDEEVIGVFADLFQKRADSARQIPIQPLDDYVKFASLKIADVPAARDIDANTLDNIYLVNVNGDVFTRPFAYDKTFCLGNLNHCALTDMIEGDAYRSCQQVIRRRKAENCAVCEFRGFCDSSPMHEHGSVTPGDDGERCRIPRRSIAEIEQALISAGVDRSVIGTWARQWLMPGRVATE